MAPGAYLLLTYKVRDANTGFTYSGTKIIGTYATMPKTPIIDLKNTLRLCTHKIETVLSTEWYLYISMGCPGPHGLSYTISPQNGHANMKVSLHKNLGLSNRELQVGKYVLYEYDYVIIESDNYQEI
ncbi:putative matrix protein [Anisopteromalus calandrae negative-strand RNA virus 2]|uniref:Matrix protein n=1 Tax=Anisopteromalus calandrae negative-strand RNA virus 2 TaxID=2848910 RepID=A0AAE7RY91_9MONO|nr:putative matrix protein [Anisopteromalus calandrae negative-strand RNA virus 2]QWT43288.1 putative matrix protein [Anisopteromalus calandrae negative-strand RNA virus 2]